MRNRIKILVGALALAVPVACVAAVTVPALQAGASLAPAYPVVCKMSATVTFSPALTKAGVDTTNKAAVTSTTISGGTLSSCISADPAGAPSGGTIATTTIKTPATKSGKVGKVMHYLIGSCPAFAQAGTLKSLKNLALTVSWSGGQGGSSTFTVKKAEPAINDSGEVGFAFSGKAVLGSYSEKALNQITAYLAPPSTSTALATGCSGNQVVTGATVDTSFSVAVL
ncbi:MAG TPA: hypothetical protein VMV22_09860 [Acidimicrobiales bacterium]|nr:hypothetical protein [Acidimicrobiales bacterium]